MKLLDDLLKEQDASRVQAWLDSVWSGQQQAPDDPNWWQAVAYDAAQKARLGSDLTWAQVATSVYDHLATQADNAGRNSFMLSSMMLRADMISRLGVVPGHPVLDIDNISRWFFDSLEIPYEEASRQADAWTELQVEDIRKLRAIKNRLGVIKLLSDEGLLDDTELSKWLLLRDKLP